MSFPFVQKSVTLNDLERPNGHSKVTRTDMTKAEPVLRCCNANKRLHCKRLHCGDKFTVIPFASAFAAVSTRPSESFGHG